MTKIILGKSNMQVFLKNLNKTCNENNAIWRGKFKNYLQRHFLFRLEMDERKTHFNLILTNNSTVVFLIWQYLSCYFHLTVENVIIANNVTSISNSQQ